MGKNQTTSVKETLRYISVGRIRSIASYASKEALVIDYLLDQADKTLTEGEVVAWAEYQALVGIRDGLEEVIVKAQKYTSTIKNANGK